MSTPLHVLDEPLQRWLVQAAGGAVLDCRRVGVGGSRETYFVEVASHGGPRSLVLRCEGEGPLTGTEFTLQREAVVYRAAMRAGLRMPALVAVEPRGRALLIERAAGSSDLTALSQPERNAVLKDFMGCIAQLHRADVDGMDLPGFERPTSAQDHARLNVQLWGRVAAGLGESIDPVLSFAAGWLWAHAPTRVPRTALVQADTGPGNLVALSGRVTALIDLELAYIGDPMDDLAWIEMRLGGLGVDRDELFSLYSDLSGVAVDEERLGYYRLLVLYRAAVTTSLAAQRGGGVRGPAAYVVETERFVQKVAAQLSLLTGVTESVPNLPRPHTPRQPWFQHVRETMRAAAGDIADAVARNRLRNAQAFLYYLQAYDAVGAEVSAADLADRHMTFRGADDLASMPASFFEAAARQGRDDVLRYVLRRAARQRILWRDAIDRPARWRE